MPASQIGLLGREPGVFGCQSGPKTAIVAKLTQTGRGAQGGCGSRSDLEGRGGVVGCPEAGWKPRGRPPHAAVWRCVALIRVGMHTPKSKPFFASGLYFVLVVPRPIGLLSPAAVQIRPGQVIDINLLFTRLNAHTRQLN
jgi:hypothetical protein